MWQPNGNQVLAQRAWVSGALYSEADFESTTVPHLRASALNFEHNDFHRTTTGNDLKSKVVGIDGVYKFKGCLATGEYFFRQRNARDGRRSSTPTAAIVQARHDAQSVSGPGRRRSATASATSTARVDNDDITEIRGGLSYYYRRHALKFQMDVGQVETGLGASTAARGRTTSSGCRRSSSSRVRHRSARVTAWRADAIDAWEEANHEARICSHRGRGDRRRSAPSAQQAVQGGSVDRARIRRPAASRAASAASGPTR